MIYVYLAIIVLCLLVLHHLHQGAVYLPSHKEALQVMLEMTDARPGIRIADLGSGDGRVLIAFAKRGAEAVGFEINPVLIWLSRIKINQAGLKNNAQVVGKSFWNENLGQFDVIVVFGMAHIMDRLEAKLIRELKPEAIILSNVFKFKKLVLAEEKYGVRKYRI